MVLVLLFFWVVVVLVDGVVVLCNFYSVRLVDVVFDLMLLVVLLVLFRMIVLDFVLLDRVLF